MISVIIPTVEGREDVLEKCVTEYEATCPHAELIIIHDKPTCGIAWAEGAALATGDYIHFTADDLYPYAGWWEAATEICDRGSLPAAWVMGGGSRINCTVPIEGPGDLTPNVLVPFFSREQFDLGGWVIPIHYGTDDWISFLAVKRDIQIELSEEYSFEHTAAMEGRLHDNRRFDVPELCRLMQKEWFTPFCYEQIAHALDPSFQLPLE